MNNATGPQNAAFAEDDPDPIEDLLLTAYPNPDRIGCPGSAIITALGNRKMSKTDAVRDHIWHCSPCFKEFKAVRDARWRREEAQARQGKRIRSVAAIAAAVLMVASAFYIVQKGYLFKRHQELVSAESKSSVHNSSAQISFVTLNLLNVDTDRADEQRTIDLPPVPRSLVEVHIVLPRFSGTGHYSIMVLKSHNARSAIAEASTEATGNDTVAEVTVRLDLTHAVPNLYRLATRRGEDKAMYYYPLRIID